MALQVTLGIQALIPIQSPLHHLLQLFIQLMQQVLHAPVQKHPPLPYLLNQQYQWQTAVYVQEQLLR